MFSGVWFKFSLAERLKPNIILSLFCEEVLGISVGVRIALPFLSLSVLKVICSEFLDNSEQKTLYKLLKLKSESIMIDTKNILNQKDFDYVQKMVYDNLICEYNNFTNLLEGLERAGKN